MSVRARRILIVSILAVLAVLGTQLALGKKKDKTPADSMEPQKRAAHALNRLAYGPRPGEVDRVAKMGVDQWIEQQLHPEKIDDSALEAKLAPFRTLRMDTRELVENFPPPQVIKQVSEGKASLPHDPVNVGASVTSRTWAGCPSIAIVGWDTTVRRGSARIVAAI